MRLTDVKYKKIVTHLPAGTRVVVHERARIVHGEKSPGRDKGPILFDTISPEVEKNFFLFLFIFLLLFFYHPTGPIVGWNNFRGASSASRRERRLSRESDEAFHRRGILLYIFRILNRWNYGRGWIKGVFLFVFGKEGQLKDSSVGRKSRERIFTFCFNDRILELVRGIARLGVNLKIKN